MKNLLSRFAVLGTVSQRNVFTHARTQLTLVYLVLIAGILVFFSVLMLATVRGQLHEEYAEHASEEAHEVFSEVFYEDFYEHLLIIDICIFITSGVLAYFLAGRTLRPIEEMLHRQEVFSGNVAHELRTPLSALYAATSAALRRSGTVEEYVETLTDIHVMKPSVSLHSRNSYFIRLVRMQGRCLNARTLTVYLRELLIG